MERQREGTVGAMRAFNRFYTRLLGLLNERLLDSPVSLTEARILWEISHRANLRAEDLIAALGVDRGYLSRILRRLEKQGILSRTAHATDGRMRLLGLTPAGERLMGELDAQASAQIRRLLQGLAPRERSRLTAAMGEIQDLLSLRGRPGRRIMS